MKIDRRDCMTAMAGLLLSRSAARAADSPGIDPPFRRAEGPNRARIYLLGGAAPKDRSWLTPKIQWAINECTTLWQEDPPKPNVFNRELNIELSRRASGDLFDDLTEAEESRVLKAAKTLDMPLNVLRTMKPWGVGAAIAAVHNSKPRSSPPPESGQLVLQNMAMARGVPVKSEMAEWDDWVRFYAAFPQKAAVQYMLYQIDLSGLPSDAFERWSDQWLRGDESAWARFNDRLLTTYPDLYQVLEVQRNERWADRIDGMMASGGTHLINVGVQHTVGANSIQVIAGKRGVRFRRI